MSPEMAQPTLHPTVESNSIEKENELVSNKLKSISSHKHNRQSRYSPYLRNIRDSRQNLFMEGFQDCAAEVVRFLREEDGTNPLLLHGLQHHLKTVSQVICPESISNVDNDLQSESCSFSHSNVNNSSNHDDVSLSSHLPLIPKSTQFLDQCAININTSQMDCVPFGSQLPNRNIHQFCDRCSIASGLSSHNVSCHTSHCNTSISTIISHPIHSLRTLASEAVNCAEDKTTLSILESQKPCQNCTARNLIVTPDQQFVNNFQRESLSAIPTQSSSQYSTTSLANLSAATHTPTPTQQPFVKDLHQPISTNVSMTSIFSPPEFHNTTISSAQTTSSTDSDTFTDTLLAVETCKDHIDPRVRALAEELIGLIHGDYDDDYSDDDEEEDETGDGLNILDDSGIGMESSCDGNRLDMLK